MKEQCTLPMIALRGIVILPHTTVHFDISRAESVSAMKQAMKKDQMLFAVTQQDVDNSQGFRMETLQKIGCLVQVKQMVRLPKNIVRVLAEGIERAELLDFEERDGYYHAEVQTFPEAELTAEQNQAYCTSMMEEVRRCYEAGMSITPVVLRKLSKIRKAAEMTDILAEQLPFAMEQKQRILDFF